MPPPQQARANSHTVASDRDGGAELLKAADSQTDLGAAPTHMWPLD